MLAALTNLKIIPANHKITSHMNFGQFEEQVGVLLLFHMLLTKGVFSVVCVRVRWLGLDVLPVLDTHGVIGHDADCR